MADGSKLYRDESMIDLTRDGDVFVPTMNDGENRWTTTCVRAFAAALDTVEASEGHCHIKSD
jgi:hypothetical protein